MNENQVKQGRLCLVPFFGIAASEYRSLGESPFGETTRGEAKTRDQRRDYLRQTLASTAQFFEETIVTCVLDRDETWLRESFPHIEVVRIEGPPLHLPCNSLAWLQDELTDRTRVHLVGFTEADQVLHYPNLDSDLELISDGYIIAPVRIERKYGKGIRNRGLDIVFDDKPYVAYAICGEQGLRHYRNLCRREKQDHYWLTENREEAYAGAWVCSRESFVGASFALTDRQPTEEASYSVFRNSRVLKPTRWDYCYVDHLSGYDFQKIYDFYRRKKWQAWKMKMGKRVGELVSRLKKR